MVIICINEAGCINEPQNKCLQSLVVLLKAWCCHFTHINLPGTGTILNKRHWSSCLHLTLVHHSYGLRTLYILIYKLTCTLKLNLWRTSVTAVSYIKSVCSQSDVSRLQILRKMLQRILHSQRTQLFSVCATLYIKQPWGEEREGEKERNVKMERGKGMGTQGGWEMNMGERR